MPDPRWPGTGNYLDWLFDLDPIGEEAGDRYMTAANVDEIVTEMQRRLRAYQSGVKVKKDSTPIDLVAIGLSTPSNFKRRKL